MTISSQNFFATFQIFCHQRNIKTFQTTTMSMSKHVRVSGECGNVLVTVTRHTTRHRLFVLSDMLASVTSFMTWQEHLTLFAQINPFFNRVARRRDSWCDE